uniref:Uncharacterized protein n=1 Tax=Oryza rufipogon TaxID=4529 RepID=A0A0E0RDF5_ORYRU
MATVVRACMPLPPAAVASSSAAPSTDAQAQRSPSSSSARVLVLGGTGRVGGENECTVLQAAIATKTAYIDVCDDTDYSWRAKGFHEQAKDCGIPAITTAGIYPGPEGVAIESRKVLLERASQGTTIFVMNK